MRHPETPAHLHCTKIVMKQKTDLLCVCGIMVNLYDLRKLSAAVSLDSLVDEMPGH